MGLLQHHIYKKSVRFEWFYSNVNYILILWDVYIYSIKDFYERLIGSLDADIY